ncbi:MAG: hypothetical protein HZB26_24575 [Candidatus Hydrogenedentes bacterium]|nr:hypothetical protein [Candidatus Hydrogenedentota bacterium]
MTDRENWLRAIDFQYPEWIPCAVGLSLLTWHTHREKLEDLVLRHPALFPGFQRGSVDFDDFPPVYRAGEDFRDNWGCLWRNVIGGLEGVVVEHPLADWSALDAYRAPDPKLLAERGERDWDQIRDHILERKRRGEATSGNGERLFDRLYFLRGFENLMTDIATDDPNLPRLIELLTEYEMKLIGMYLDLNVDVMGFHTDIGTQQGLMISPDKFRQYIKPMFKTLFSACRKAGARVALSSDGRLLDIVDDLIDCGVSVHDPQARANTLQGIEDAYKGKMCVNLDLDRQMFAFCTPEDVREHVREAVERLYLPEGGLMLTGQVYDAQTPLENIEALCAALEEYCLKPKTIISAAHTAPHR